MSRSYNKNISSRTSFTIYGEINSSLIDLGISKLTHSHTDHEDLESIESHYS